MKSLIGAALVVGLTPTGATAASGRPAAPVFAEPLDGHGGQSVDGVDDEPVPTAGHHRDPGQHVRHDLVQHPIHRCVPLGTSLTEQVALACGQEGPGGPESTTTQWLATYANGQHPLTIPQQIEGRFQLSDVAGESNRANATIERIVPTG